MPPEPVSGSRERILFHLKTRGAQTAAQLAERLGQTAVSIRQHLGHLAEQGLVTFEELRGGRGRPARTWRLTPEGNARFPEGYAELALDLIGGVRRAFGGKGLARLVAARTSSQLVQYGEALPDRESPLRERVAALARLRTREGYMCEWRGDRDGTLTLVENHCPICAAAEVCQGICGGELELFRELLPDAEVERTEHILEGARRCAYRITPLDGGTPPDGDRAGLTPSMEAATPSGVAPKTSRPRRGRRSPEGS